MVYPNQKITKEEAEEIKNSKLTRNKLALKYGISKNQVGRIKRGECWIGPTTREEMFWAKVEKSENCWNWKAAKNNNGYGLFGISKGKLQTAHRYSYELHKGPIPKGSLVLHSCDNKLCVNPDHLRLGTQAMNVHDQFTHGKKSTTKFNSNP